MDGKGLGMRIKASRKEQGLTGEKLSEACNINATYLRQIEAGTRTPSLPMFVEICRQLKASPGYLLMDSFQGEEPGDMERIAELMKIATPNQAELICAMVESAISVIGEEKGQNKKGK